MIEGKTHTPAFFIFYASDWCIMLSNFNLIFWSSKTAFSLFWHNSFPLDAFAKAKLEQILKKKIWFYLSK